MKQLLPISSSLWQPPVYVLSLCSAPPSAAVNSAAENICGQVLFSVCFQFIGYMPSIRTVQMNSRILRGTSKWLFILYAVIFFSSPSLSLPFPSLPFTYLFLVPRLTVRTPQPNPPPGTSGQPSDLLDENKRSCHARRAHRPSFTVLTAQKAHGKQPKKKVTPRQQEVLNVSLFLFFSPS